MCILYHVFEIWAIKFDELVSVASQWWLGVSTRGQVIENRWIVLSITAALCRSILEGISNLTNIFSSNQWVMSVYFTRVNLRWSFIPVYNFGQANHHIFESLHLIRGFPSGKSDHFYFIKSLLFLVRSDKINKGLKWEKTLCWNFDSDNWSTNFLSFCYIS